MRVITGAAKGRRLETLPGLATRPTTEVTKEAVFSIIQFEVEGAAVLDLFAGSGQMGIEALSRGAKSCVFVDNAKACQQIQKKNLTHTGLLDRARIIAGDAAAYLKLRRGPFDIAFLDPPYGQNHLARLLGQLADSMTGNGVILCETSRDESPPETAGELVKRREYRYGKTKISLYRRPEADGDEAEA